MALLALKLKITDDFAVVCHEGAVVEDKIGGECVDGAFWVLSLLNHCLGLRHGQDDLLLLLRLVFDLDLRLLLKYRQNLRLLLGRYCYLILSC